VLSPTIIRPPEHFELASIGFTVAIADIHCAAGLPQ
jgi:hypothetical protein